MRQSIPHPLATRSLPTKTYPDLGVQPRPTKEEYDRKNREETIKRYETMQNDIGKYIESLKKQNVVAEPVLVPVKIEKVQPPRIDHSKLFVEPIKIQPRNSTLLNKPKETIDISNTITKKTSSKK